MRKGAINEANKVPKFMYIDLEVNLTEYKKDFQLSTGAQSKDIHH